MRLVILTLAIVSSFVDCQPTSGGGGGLNDFALRLLDHVASEREDNFLISSVSVWNLLTLLAEGASGPTFDELMLQLNLPKNQLLTRELYSYANAILNANTSDVLLKRVGSIYIDKTLTVHPDFQDMATRTYNTNIREVDTSDLKNVAGWINYDVCAATEGRILEIVKPEALQDLRMMLVDALYFRAQWTNPFDVQYTREEDFYDDRGRKVGKVNMMHQKAPNALTYLDDISAQVLELTYGLDKKYSMIILVPFDGIQLKRFIKNVTQYPVKNIFDKLKRTTNPSSSDCYVPRFKITSDLDLERPLKYMGINEIFEADRASLPGISDNPLYVSKVIQKGELEVTEEGTTAAAAAVVGLEDRILGRRIEINKPFVYMVVERESQLILFSGVYSIPNLV